MLWRTRALAEEAQKQADAVRDTTARLATELVILATDAYALGLGMVEMIARSGGRLESLWLDEGFGPLDRSNLDAAIEALASVAARGAWSWSYPTSEPWPTR